MANPDQRTLTVAEDSGGGMTGFGPYGDAGVGPAPVFRKYVLGVRPRARRNMLVKALGLS